LERLYGKDKTEKETMMNASNVFSTSTWIGIRLRNRIDCIGYNLPFSQDFQQNGAHRSFFGHSNYYLDYSSFKTEFYLKSGYYNPFSLWGY